jgi:hypothetical protein
LSTLFIFFFHFVRTFIFGKVETLVSKSCADLGNNCTRFLQNEKHIHIFNVNQLLRILSVEQWSKACF